MVEHEIRLVAMISKLHIGMSTKLIWLQVPCLMTGGIILVQLFICNNKNKKK